jgi:hypothetical protein
LTAWWWYHTVVILVRALMGLMKDRHGTYYARVKVPERLQEAVARGRDQGKERQSFLKKSLGTKVLKEANIRAKPVLAGFDRELAEAEQLLAARPMRESLSATEIKRMAEIYYATMLDNDETARREGTGSEPVFQSIASQLTAAGIFHSFRHGFKDALRQGKVNQEIHDALTGHAQASTVSGGYPTLQQLIQEVIVGGGI